MSVQLLFRGVLLLITMSQNRMLANTARGFPTSIFELIGTYLLAGLSSIVETKTDTGLYIDVELLLLRSKHGRTIETIKKKILQRIRIYL